MARKYMMRSGNFKTRLARAGSQGILASQPATLARGKIAAWKKRLLNGASELFGDRRVRLGAGVEEEQL